MVAAARRTRSTGVVGRSIVAVGRPSSRPSPTVSRRSASRPGGRARSRAPGRAARRERGCSALRSGDMAPCPATRRWPPPRPHEGDPRGRPRLGSVASARTRGASSELAGGRCDSGGRRAGHAPSAAGSSALPARLPAASGLLLRPKPQAKNRRKRPTPPSPGSSSFRHVRGVARDAVPVSGAEPPRNG